VSALHQEQSATVFDGRDFLRRGFTVAQVARDCGDLGAAITELAFECNAIIELDEFRTLDRCLDNAIAAAKLEIPTINKNKRVDFKSAKGHTQYSYEDLAEIAEALSKPLGNHGLSYRFRTASSAPDHIAVTCIISHRDGYSEETTLSGSPDASGNKNSIQAIGSAITYLQRYTLKAALGLAASNDDDGQAAGKRERWESVDDYVERWMIYLEDADSADEITLKWNGEAPQRNDHRMNALRP